MYKVVEIFRSIEGEGKRAGLPCTFIRLHGCNLECSWCDTRYACDGDDYKEMDLDDILVDLDELYERRGLVTLTGGEPLLDFSGAMALVRNLCGMGYEVNVETNGSVRLYRGAFERPDGMFYTMDLKCPSSGMVNRQQIENLAELCQDDVLKIVAADLDDLYWAKDVLDGHPTTAQVFASPVFGRMNLVDLTHFSMEQGWRVQMQMHKQIWAPDTRGV